MKKILFLTYDFPYPTNTGGKNRAYHMLKYSDSQFKKYLFSFVRPGFDPSNIHEMEKIGVEVLATQFRKKVTDVRNIAGLIGQTSIFKALYFSKNTLSDIVKLVREYEIDIVHFESLYTAFYISEEIRKLGVLQVFGTENIEYKTYQDYAETASFFLKPLYAQQVKKIKREEEALFAAVDICIAVSDKEAEIIRKFNAKCDVVRNGVDIDEFRYKKPRDAAHNLLFVGNFSYFPNVDAINFFYHKVFRNMSGDFKLTIVGKNVSKLSFVKDPRIETLEFIPKIQDAYDVADIVVSPVRSGGGTNFKILEAFAAGVPVVSLPQRLEGLDVKNGENIMIADDAAAFASAIDTLAKDQKLRLKISENARKLAEDEYSWGVIGKKLTKVWNNL